MQRHNARRRLVANSIRIWRSHLSRVRPRQGLAHRCCRGVIGCCSQTALVIGRYRSNTPSAGGPAVTRQVTYKDRKQLRVWPSILRRDMKRHMKWVTVIGAGLALLAGVVAADAQIGYGPGVNPSNPQYLSGRSNPQDLTLPGGSNRQDLVRPSPGARSGVTSPSRVTAPRYTGQQTPKMAKAKKTKSKQAKRQQKPRSGMSATEPAACPGCVPWTCADVRAVMRSSPVSPAIVARACPSLAVR
jgi:hypothetical protein